MEKYKQLTIEFMSAESSSDELGNPIVIHKPEWRSDSKWDFFCNHFSTSLSHSLSPSFFYQNWSSFLRNWIRESLKLIKKTGNIFQRGKKELKVQCYSQVHHPMLLSGPLTRIGLKVQMNTVGFGTPSTNGTPNAYTFLIALIQVSHSPSRSISILFSESKVNFWLTHIEMLRLSQGDSNLVTTLSWYPCDKVVTRIALGCDYFGSETVPALKQPCPHFIQT